MSFAHNVHHDDVVIESINRHIHLLSRHLGLPGADQLTKLNRLALEHGPNITCSMLDEAHITSALLNTYVPALINPASPGLGNPNAEIIVLGKALAYSPFGSITPFVLESTALAALWKMKANGEVVAWLAGKPAWHQVAARFAENPEAYYGKQRSIHTWGRISNLLCQATVGTHWAESYVIDISDKPQPQGVVYPSAERLDFLSWYFARATAKVLLIQGKSPGWLRKLQERLAGSFLVEPVKDPPGPSRHVRWTDAQSDKVVIFTDHLTYPQLASAREGLAGILRKSLQ